MTITGQQQHSGGGAAGDVDRHGAGPDGDGAGRGVFLSPTTVATGGVEFDPIGGGSTAVSATAAGFRAATPVDVTVSAPAMSLFSLPGLVGAGLMSGTYTARLGATAHGGVTGPDHEQQSSAAAGVARMRRPPARPRSTSRCPTAAPTRPTTFTGLRARAGAVTLDGDGQRLHAGPGQRDRRGARVAAGRRAGDYDDVVDEHGVLRVSGGPERRGPVRRLSAGARRGGERDDHGEQQHCGGGAAGDDRPARGRPGP